MSDATETAARFLSRTIDDIGTLADLYAESVVIEMPFAAPLFPTVRHTTREELRAGFTRASSRRYTRVENVRILETTDPCVAVIEYELHGVSAPGGAEFTLAYIQIITVEEGLIVHSRDYGSPVQVAQAFGLVDRLVAGIHG
ncbi:nuclear transport factor 2 family protein [Planctomonas sp. JC2975]|uniref:nuclear transport factor 2 family protein n=1 Tax=Planctomonas sp. JC2975 TaxID=2729626 RepID=UPI0014735356|nr:nuclear transport factor 2 family protein [Planctomonas sp. JC2975]